MADKQRLVAYVLTRNEEARLERALMSLRQVTSEILVVDSGSTDTTRTIARQLGAKVVIHPFAGFGPQHEWSRSYLIETYNPDYLLSLDADESLSRDLITDIQDRMATDRLVDDIYLLNLRIEFDGRILRWGGFANTWLPRLFKPDAGQYENRLVNPHMSVRASTTIGRLHGYFINHDVPSWDAYIDKHNRYSSLEAAARVDLHDGLTTKTSLAEALRQPYLRRRWLRQTIWDRLPARPAVRFIQLYILAGGILDGRSGFRRALFESWQEMCTDLKAEELFRTRKSSPRPSGYTGSNPRKDMKAAE
jgi:glycosyltransferase involved in cell wall biosynthesis